MKDIFKAQGGLDTLRSIRDIPKYLNVLEQMDELIKKEERE